MNAQLLFPNVLRRLLESFLGFKKPGSTGDFVRSMRTALAELDSTTGRDNSGIRVHVTRFAHQYSHSEPPDVMRFVPPDELGTTTAQAFAFMDLLDHDHYAGLCAFTGGVRRLPRSRLRLIPVAERPDQPGILSAAEDLRRISVARRSSLSVVAAPLSVAE
ncbi:hypothetical protein [Cellulomonas denverensis]|uniref:Uncharacterized protein n=1 Tax=Cellulomonas denverensis TaxID=264297 RepID=A0A7X6QYR8_9CELL|nr:hypothetical protein [Cellulomonas denverensis]NKY22417.1 hypothetical protein [Cellulomonas denverensis]GIG27348.1 hypothetical protein Cde04nite_35920 [Cellulomonas denverensis]